MISSVSSAYRPSMVRRAAVVTDGAAPQAAATQPTTVSAQSQVSAKSFLGSIWESISGFFTSIFSSITSSIKQLLGM